MVAVLYLERGRNCFVVRDDTGQVCETREYREHAEEVLLLLGRSSGKIPSEAHQLVRDGKTLILQQKTTLVVSAKGQTLVQRFDTRADARAWLKAYKKKVQAWKSALKYCRDRYDILVSNDHARFMWRVYRNHKWLVSFRTKDDAHRFIYKEARK